MYCVSSYRVYIMLIERMIQLPQESSIPGIVYNILLERKPLPAIISMNPNSAIGVMVRLLRMLKHAVPHVKLRLLLDIKPFWKLRSLRSRSVSLTRLVALPTCKCRLLFMIEG